MGHFFAEWSSRFSLRTRFIALIAALVFATTLMLGWVASRESAQQLEAHIGSASSRAAYQMVNMLDRSMDARIKQVNLLLAIQTLGRDTQPHVLRRQLERLQDSFNIVSWIGLTDTQGTVRVATDGILEGLSIAHRPVFVEGQHRPWVGDVHEAVMLASLLPSPTGEALKFVDIATPVHDRRGEFSGVLAVHLSWEWAEYIERTLLAPAEKQQDADLLLLSSDATVLLGPHELLGRSLNSLKYVPRPGNTTPSWAVETWPDGQRYVTGYARSGGFEDFEGLGWVAISRQPVSDAFAPAKRLQAAIMSIGLLLAVVFAAVGWCGASFIVAPIKRLAQAADRIGEGDQAGIIPLERGASEFKRLSVSLREMVGRLSDQRQTISRLEDLANSDPLTGLPNRAFLMQYLQHAVPEAQRHLQNMVVMYIDLDGFKRVNDELGHHAGDLLLIEITNRLKNALRSGDVVARLGGDEFVMVLKTQPEYLEPLTHEVGRRLLNAIERPIQLAEGQTATVGCSLGAAWWPHHGEHIETVLKLADNALYAAKSQGKHRLVIHRPGR
ncbi:MULTISPECIES: diguanylate cyclase domain-containing protein [unclassified Halomonas]|uniref:sensor domain-containing diguanylate cyclase n=1 Tax=unclassified Halomonas TaxID=2609666 RepID=UPI0021E5057A|nr:MULTISPECIES: diguanylate cyclase [unclassified Halomonas]UYG00793.1 diguanylate cyclase [Halomonas sp. GD1P12]WNL38144.1 diguanylate cyclase [Halomonas sp. PAMB 3232]WNL41469.1 diguanylate cyclase [Halomonas sp. PAMB 3264]